MFSGNIIELVKKLEKQSSTVTNKETIARAQYEIYGFWH